MKKKVGIKDKVRLCFATKNCFLVASVVLIEKKIEFQYINSSHLLELCPVLFQSCVNLYKLMVNGSG